MDRPNEKDLLHIEIPDELDQAIRVGVQKGKKMMNRRKYIQRTAAGAAAAFAVFVGSINASPALAANLEDVAVLGTLVRAFQWNAPEAAGGQDSVSGKATVDFRKAAGAEQLTLSFSSADAAAYRATLAHFPETVTLALPSTQEVQVLDAVNQAREDSALIKAVYTLGRADGASYLQIEFDDTADVSVEEYREPGRIVVNLKPGAFEGREVYSVRTLSMDEDALKQALAAFPEARVLRDETVGYLLEIGQYDSADAAEAARQAAKDPSGLLFVEKRFGNNVPGHYESQAAVSDAQIERAYADVLAQAATIQPVLDFLDQHLAGASPEVQDTLLRGLTGFIQDDPSQYDLAALGRYYQMAGQDIHKALDS